MADASPQREPGAGIAGGGTDTLIDTSFVPADFDGTEWEQIEPKMRALLERDVGSAEELEKWLLDRSELDAACSEARAELYIAMTCHTDDEEASSAYKRYIEEVPPKRRPLSFELDKRQAELAEEQGLTGGRYQVLHRETKADVELFRPENVPLLTRVEKLSQEYQSITGAMTVEFDGKERTLPQMGVYFQKTDRSVRESAWRAVAGRRLRDKDRIQDIFDEQLELRHEIALNAGFENFRDFSFKAMHRFDYTPEGCFAFHEAVERHVVPFNREVNARRKANLGVPALRPWDLAVDEKGRAPLRPFEGGEELLARSRRVFDGLGEEFGEMFAELGHNGEPGECLDLDSRKGKAPGGYQYMRDRTRRPFIFMNAAGLDRDVKTMVHEAGHAFHSQLSRSEPLLAYRGAPMEFAEVASMAMEMLSMPYWDEYYPDPEDLARAKRDQIEGHGIGILAWIAQIDAFQHWIYTNPEHTREERTAKWLELDDRFGDELDWSGLEDERAHAWHRQLHLFLHPFYYIEYGIARLGSLGLWLAAIENGEAPALEAYKRALTLGGSRPLPELFAAAGLPFDFGPETVDRLVRAARAELRKLPE